MSTQPTPAWSRSLELGVIPGPGDSLEWLEVVEVVEEVEVVVGGAELEVGRQQEQQKVQVAGVEVEVGLVAWSAGRLGGRRLLSPSSRSPG